MSLSSDLISQFVKAAKSTEKPKDETTVLGTIVYDGRPYVKLDGSDQLTPISTTADVQDGERVTVLIKNHTATVTGNISSPAARTDTVKEIGDQISEFEIIVADKVSTEELEVERGRIDTLVTENVTIKENLAAVNADIGNLNADNVTINEKLTAAEADISELHTTKLDVDIATAKYATIESLEATDADIHNLEATYGEFVDLTTEKFTAVESTIANLDATYATIENLNAEKARIDDLETTALTADSAVITDLQTEVADIDTLIFGSASGDVIQTDFANAVIAQLGNAQIKSAMIDSIAANKISSGDILTNNIRVMSEDGNLLISDETIQISDDTRVRVQIGKDASNDYSINIWDADGNLMFSEGGITDNAIKEAIIRNDMVASDANIAASKLDISSLFTEINGSTETIKSSRIYMDGEAQTLDVVFTTMSSDIDETKNAVSSQGTSLSVIQGQINSKVWQQDIDSAVDPLEEATETLSTQYSEINQEVDSITLSVESVSETANNAQDTAGEASRQIDVAKSEIELLKGSIVTLVEDENGKTALEQTGSGWRFDIDGVQQSINDTNNAVGDLADEISSTNNTLENLDKNIQDLGGSVDNISTGLSSTNNAVDSLNKTIQDLGGYVHITGEGGAGEETCLELGEAENNFKVRITPSRIEFADGSSVPAYIANHSDGEASKLMIEQAEVVNEMQFGSKEDDRCDGVWVVKQRENGNLGFMWVPDGR